MSLVRDLRFDFGDFSVDVPQMEIPDKGVTVLSGPSGSGKSSILRALIGLIQVPQMVWEFQGEDLNRLPIPERRLGVVFQNYDLFPHMSVYENVLFAARARRIPESEFLERYRRISSLLHLEEFAHRKASVVSGGERQRAALARAVIGRPRVLLLDEPFSALDSHLRSESRNLVKELVKTLEIPALLVTHDEEDVRVLADERIYIEKGRIKSPVST
ncbi:MAG: ATP-binding cassette domain-containing protein [Bdellovibrionaceae bacterium]|nr:ATP-binding cassette domain-containing protein [Pseudobdellovibrionaceae bacterium]